MPGCFFHNMNPDVLLTGATGFIGSHVLEALVEAGLRVRALVRRPAAVPDSVETCPGDIRGLDSLCRAAHGCRTVIHTAGMAKDWGARSEFKIHNVTGTRNVLEASVAQGVEHVIITGSISSYGEEDCPHPKDETCPFNPHHPYFMDSIFHNGMNDYRGSKAELTRDALDFAQSRRVNVTILEPVWVYGEREFGTGFYSYVKTVQDGSRLMPGSTRNKFHVIYAKDLARAYLLACQKRLPGVERIIIGPPKAELMSDVFGRFCDECGVRRPRLIPRWSIYPAAVAMELAWTLARRPSPPLLTRARVDMFYDSIEYSTGKARSLLGFQCLHSLEEGIRRTVAWYKKNHYL
jgi:nucleoside-diphosphate-sugar epimerase